MFLCVSCLISPIAMAGMQWYSHKILMEFYRLKIENNDIREVVHEVEEDQDENDQFILSQTRLFSRRR